MSGCLDLPRPFVLIICFCFDNYSMRIDVECRYSLPLGAISPVCVVHCGPCQEEMLTTQLSSEDDKVRQLSRLPWPSQ